jgi:hypothetical protein
MDPPVAKPKEPAATFFGAFIVVLFLGAAVLGAVMLLRPKKHAGSPTGPRSPSKSPDKAHWSLWNAQTELVPCKTDPVTGLRKCDAGADFNYHPLSASSATACNKNCNDWSESSGTDLMGITYYTDPVGSQLTRRSGNHNCICIPRTNSPDVCLNPNGLAQTKYRTDFTATSNCDTTTVYKGDVIVPGKQCSSVSWTTNFDRCVNPTSFSLCTVDGPPITYPPQCSGGELPYEASIAPVQYVGSYKHDDKMKEHCSNTCHCSDPLGFDGDVVVSMGQDRSHKPDQAAICGTGYYYFGQCTMGSHVVRDSGGSPVDVEGCKLCRDNSDCTVGTDCSGQCT